MRLVKLPKLFDYWSKDEITGHTFASTQQQLCFVIGSSYFSRYANLIDYTELTLNVMNTNFAKHYTLGEDLCIDESVVPFRGRIIFRQYKKHKRYK